MDRSILAVNLAGIGALEHRKVAVIDVTAPQYSLTWGALRKENNIKPKVPVFGPMGLREDLANPYSYLRTHYRDIIIDTDGVDRLNADSALVASQLAILPIWFQKTDDSVLDELIHRVKEVRLFNPGMRILIVRLQSISASSSGTQEATIAAAFAHRIPGAILSDTVLHERWNPRRAFDSGLTISEDEPVSDTAVAELRKLHEEIGRIHQTPSPARDTSGRSEAILEHLRGK